MHPGQHLVLGAVDLPPAGEWQVLSEGWVFVRVAGGIGYLLRRSGPSELRAGEVILVRGGESAVFRASQLGKLELAAFQVSLRHLPGLLSPLELRQLAHLTAANRLGTRQFSVVDEVAQLYAEMMDAVGETPIIGLRCRMLEIFGLVVVDELTGQAQPARPLTLARERFERVMGKTSEVELQRHSPADLARECGCSERHFSRLFREVFGKSIRARQIELRLIKAQELLRESDAKVADVARASGYQHLGLFSAKFKQRFGMTPSQWRVRNRPPNARSSRPRVGGKRPALVVTETSLGRRQPATVATQHAEV